MITTFSQMMNEPLIVSDGGSITYRDFGAYIAKYSPSGQQVFASYDDIVNELQFLGKKVYVLIEMGTEIDIEQRIPMIQQCQEMFLRFIKNDEYFI